MFFKTNKDVTIDNTTGALHQYCGGSWVWKPELELKADTKYEINEVDGVSFIREYGDIEITNRVGADKDTLMKTISSLSEVREIEDNTPKFIGFVKLLDAMCKEGIIQRDPEDSNAILVYRTNVDKQEYGVSEGWFSQNIFEVAQETIKAYKEGDRSLFEALDKKGYSAVFTVDGEFAELKKNGREIDLNRIVSGYEPEPDFSNFDYEGETQALLEQAKSTELKRVFSYEDCELEPSYVGFLHSYKDLSESLPKDFTIIDIGSYQAVQSEYFKDFEGYISVDSGCPESVRYHTLNSTHFEMSGQDFIKDILPTLKESGLDLNKTFCICSYVPDEKLRNELIPEAFPYYRSTYAGCKTQERLPETLQRTDIKRDKKPEVKGQE